MSPKGRSGNDDALHNPIVQMVGEIERNKSDLALMKADRPLFDIQNENSPSQITSNQNNYSPGNYDVLRLTSDALRMITGIADGKKGRILFLTNVGSYVIGLSHDSGSSSAANRIYCYGSRDTAIPPGSTCALYYDSTTSRWRQMDKCGIGSATLVRYNPAPTNKGSGYNIEWNTEVYDDENWHNNAVNNTRITPGIAGRYQAFCAVTVGAHGADTNYWLTIGLSGVTVLVIEQKGIIDTGTGVWLSASTFPFSMSSTDYIEVSVNWDGGGNKNLAMESYGFSLMRV